MPRVVARKLNSLSLSSLSSRFTQCASFQLRRSLIFRAHAMETHVDSEHLVFDYLTRSMKLQIPLKNFCRPNLKEHMQYCIDHPGEISKLAKLKAQVSEIKGVKMENTDKILDRGERIELLMDKSENLHHQAHGFKMQCVLVSKERLIS